MSVDRGLFRYPLVLVPDPDEPPLDAETELDPDLVDEIAIERACDGHHVDLTRLERIEVIRRLHARGMSDAVIAERVGIAERTVERTRRRHGIRDRQAQTA